jgi:FAD/FMN-containing dehydrogenase
MTELTGRVLYPGDPGWDAARVGFAKWADYEANLPRAVVFCQDKYDAANAINWARKNGAPFRVRCGRHNYEGYSSLLKDGIIIDVSDINQVYLNHDRTLAVVGAGIDMEDLFEKLGAANVTIPAATGPTVGLAGLTLGGGFGVTSRKWGLTCDNLIDIELVNAAGEIIHANAEHHSDLFWACRGGGGGNFGVVTAFTFHVHKVKNVAVYDITWSWDQFESLVTLWQTWAHDADDGLSSALALLAPQTIAGKPNQPGKVNMYGQYTADDADLPHIHDLMQPLFDVAKPIETPQINIVPHLIGTRIILGVDATKPMALLVKHSDDQIFKSTSALAYGLFSADVIKMLKQGLESVPPLSVAPSQPSMIQLLGGGGYVSRILTDATAVYHRKAQFVVQYDAYWTAPEDGHKTLGWIKELRNTLQPYTRGAYVNYQDDSIKDWLRAYYEDNLERLVEIKCKYDPDNIFNFQQSIPLKL